MKARGAILQGALALAGLGAVYATWQRPEQTAPGDVVVLDLGRGELSRIRYEDGTKWVELERHRDRSAPAILIKQGKSNRPPPDGGVGASAPEMKPTPRGELRANDFAEKLFERFEPLKANRALGTLDPSKLRELGLQDSAKSLQVEGRTGKYAFRISTSVLGAGSPYLQNVQDGRVYLLGNTALSDLESAPVRLVDRQLHTFKLPEVDSFVVKVNDKQRTFSIKAIANQPTIVAPKKSPQKPDEFVRNWHDKMWHLVVLDVLGKGDVPASGEPNVALRLEYSNRGNRVGWLELATPAASSSANARELYARSEHTIGWVKVHSASEDQLKEANRVVTE
jgi:hypothetical protein